jgi:hypothetical protein
VLAVSCDRFELKLVKRERKTGQWAQSQRQKQQAIVVAGNAIGLYVPTLLAAVNDGPFSIALR